MNAERIKACLYEVAARVNEHTTWEDIYDHLLLLKEVEEAEDQMEAGEVISHEEVKKVSQRWLK